MVNIKLLHMVR